jgi:hypothetical protein
MSRPPSIHASDSVEKNRRILFPAVDFESVKTQGEVFREESIETL